MRQNPWLLVFFIGIGLIGLALVSFGAWMLTQSNLLGLAQPAPVTQTRLVTPQKSGMLIITATLDDSASVLTGPSDSPNLSDADLSAPSAVTPMVPTPTALIPWFACQDSYPSYIRPGSRASVSLEPALPNNVREQPDIASKVLFAVQPGDVVDIIGGPGCSSGWVWWHIQNSSGRTGWTAEGDGKDYWLIPVH